MEVASRQIVEVVKVAASQNVLLQISVVPRDEQKKRHNWMEEEDWMDFYNAIEDFVKGNCNKRNTAVLSGKLLRLRVKVEKIDKDAVKSLKDILGGGFEWNDITDGLRCRIEFLKKKKVRSVGKRRSFRRTPIKETAYSKKLLKPFNNLDYNRSTEKKCSCNKEDNKNSKTRISIGNEEVSATSFEEKFFNEQDQNSLIDFKCRECVVRLININESNNNLGTFGSDIPINTDKQLDCHPIFETEYDPNSEEMERSNTDASKDTSVVGELQKITEKTPENEDIKMTESSIKKDDSSDNVMEMGSDNVSNEIQHTNNFEELNQMIPTRKLLLGRNTSKDTDHSKINVETDVFPNDTECNQTDMHNIAEKTPEKTPEKEEENKNSDKKSLHTPSQTEEISSQIIRRSQRSRVLSKRYNHEDIKMIESSIEKDDSSDNVMEMESDTVLNESQNTNKFEELNQMTPTRKPLLSRNASKDTDHSKKNVERHVFPKDTECNQTDMHNIAEKTPEKTPEKEEENKNSDKKSLHSQSQTEDIPSQIIRRSQRSRVLSKRYSHEEFIVKSVKKSKQTLSVERSDSKYLTKTKQKNVNVQENVKPSIFKLSKTPKSCSKALFQSTSNGSKYHSNKNIEDTWLESWTSSLSKEPLLNLNDITIDEVLETLDSIKPKLDDLFKKIYHMGYVKSYENIDHFLVIRLVPDDIQKGIMTRLSDLYETKEVPKYGSHFINVLMPELILSIFMSRFNMNREDAITCIKKQNTCIATMDFDDDE